MTESAENKIACPYCGFEISNNVEFCPNCKELFTEPDIKGFKFVSIGNFIVFAILFAACGFYYLYPAIWTLLNYKTFKQIANPKDYKKFMMLFIPFFILALVPFVKLLGLICITLEIALCYRMLRIIEKHTVVKYDSPVTHHEIGMIFFRMLYVVYYLDTYAQRVHDPLLRHCLDWKKWINYSILIFILFSLLYFAGVLSVPFIH